MQAHTGRCNTHILAEHTQAPCLRSVSHNRTQTVNTFKPHRILNLRSEGDKHIYHTSALSVFISVHPSSVHLHSLPPFLFFLPSALFLQSPYLFKDQCRFMTLTRHLLFHPSSPITTFIPSHPDPSYTTPPSPSLCSPPHPALKSIFTPSRLFAFSSLPF